MIAGFHCGVNEIFDILGFYAAHTLLGGTVLFWVITQLTMFRDQQVVQKCQKERFQNEIVYHIHELTLSAAP